MDSNSTSPFRAAEGGVRVAIKLTPKASQNRIQGVVQEADGSPVIKASVTAPPEDGKANAALIELLARNWKLPKTAITVVQGASGRRKTLHVMGEPNALLSRLEDSLAAASKLGKEHG